MLVFAVAGGNVNWALGAIAPLVIALVFWITRARPAVLAFDQAGIRIPRTGQNIPYADILDVTVDGIRWREDSPTRTGGPIVIHHAHGNLTVPSSVSVSPEDLCRFLASKAPPPPRRDCHPHLSRYLADNIEKFGEEKILVIHAGRRSRKQKSKGGMKFALSLAIIGILWIAVAALGDEVFLRHRQGENWIGAGIVLLLIAVSLWLILLWAPTSNSGRQAISKDSCIIITPAGVAMVQGPLKGALRWDEVTKVELNARSSHLQIGVQGGVLKIFDGYERSLEEIAVNMRRRMG